MKKQLFFILLVALGLVHSEQLAMHHERYWQQNWYKIQSEAYEGTLTPEQVSEIRILKYIDYAPISGKTLLMEAVDGDFTESGRTLKVVKLLIENGACVNKVAYQRTGRTTEYFNVLDLAIRKKQKEMMKILVAAGATPSEYLPEEHRAWFETFLKNK